MTESNNVKEIITLLGEFQPYISIFTENDITVINFDSNMTYDLNREPKKIHLEDNYFKKNTFISMKVGDVKLINGKDNKFLEADIDLYLGINGFEDKKKVNLHKIKFLASELEEIDIYKIKLLLNDKVADAVSQALDQNYSSDVMNYQANDNSSKTHRLNGPDINELGSQSDIQKNSSKRKTWKYGKKLGIGILSLFIVTTSLWGVKSFLFNSTEPSITEIQNNPDAINAQVQLTRETLKSMGLDPSKVESDLGCLAQQK